MSKNVALFIDVANIYYAARGQDVDVDYIALLKHVTKGRDLIRAYAYSGLDPENENQRKFLDFLSKNGYKVVHKDIRKFGDGRVKANLDIELVVDLFRLQDRMDIAVIVSGDGDFASAIRALQDVGVRCEVISFRPNTSSDLIAVADEFTDIMKIIGIGRAKESKVLPMPEMPAKEVSPEFGFRVASHGVAAAALAALREGEQPSRPRRGRGTRSAVPQAVAAVAGEPTAEGDEPAEGTPAPAAHAEGAEQTDGARRRRRRRGGRGRGRGRRGDEGLEGVAPGEPGGEIGWQEFDDLSQLGELSDLGEPGEERDYGFTEADAATLAELGIAAGDQAAPTAASGAPTEPPATGAPRRRGTRAGRARGTAAQEAAAGEAAGEPAAQDATPAASTPARPRRRRGTTAAAGDEKGAETTAAQPAEAAEATPSAPSGRVARARRTTRPAAADEAPALEASPAVSASRPRRSRRTAGAATTGGDTPGEPATGSTSSDAPGGADDPGIWQRFRSGRRTTRRTTNS